MQLTALDLYKTDGILTAGPEDSLASALGKIRSSHDAVFVVQTGRLLGVISPYYVFYRGHKPAAAKVKNCLFLPPKLKPETRIDKIARLMLESKVYFLPVVTAAGKWLGMVSYRRLLRQLHGLKVKPKPLVTCRETITVSQARNLMKKTGFSRLIVVSASGRLAGILTRSDFNTSLHLPPSAPAKSLIKRSVATFRSGDNPATAVKLMLDRDIGSVVMVNKDYQPIGVLSVRDCLEELVRPKAAVGLQDEIRVKVTKVRSGFEAFARVKNVVAHAAARFKRQAIKASLKKLRARRRKN